jgi:hypothetical protein
MFKALEEHMQMTDPAALATLKSFLQRPEEYVGTGKTYTFPFKMEDELGFGDFEHESDALSRWKNTKAEYYKIVEEKFGLTKLKMEQLDVKEFQLVMLGEIARMGSPVAGGDANIVKPSMTTVDTVSIEG